MGILIDSSILIHFERAGTDLSAYVKGREGEDAFLSVISASELLHGVQHAGRVSSETARMRPMLSLTRDRGPARGRAECLSESRLQAEAGGGPSGRRARLKYGRTLPAEAGTLTSRRRNNPSRPVDGELDDSHPVLPDRFHHLDHFRKGHGLLNIGVRAEFVRTHDVFVSRR